MAKPKKQKNGLGGRLWLAIIVFCLFGQLAWGIENMYFNLFVYNTITTDPTVIADMVFASALTATLTTLLMGALSDRMGKRKGFIVGGYILWGFSTMAFAFISVNNLEGLVGAASAVHVASLVVIIMDCVMTFFGSAAYDAAFNAWVNDVSEENQRGRVEGVLGAVPLLGMMVIFVGFDGITRAGRWDIFFMIIGGLVTLGGLLGVFLIKDSPKLQPKKDNFWRDITYGFRPAVVRENKLLYIALCAMGVLGISTQVAMPYRIIYMQHYLKIESYGILSLVILLAASVISIIGGRIIDRMGKIKFIPYAVVLNIGGLLLMFFARSIGMVLLANVITVGGNMLAMAALMALMRDYTPVDKAGHFQGIRMVFMVLIPMTIGPYVGAAVINNSGEFYEELGVLRQVPTPGIFMASMLVLLLIVVPYIFLVRAGGKKAAAQEQPAAEEGDTNA